MILGPNGLNARQVTKQYDPRLAKLLMALDQVLGEQGLGLFCMKCHKLGLPDGVRGLSSNDEWVLECGCTRRTWAASGVGKVTIN